VSVTLTDLQPRAGNTAGLFDDPRKAALNTVLDRINARYGNNKLYFAAMQTALEHDAAPMRIPFRHVPDTGHRGRSRRQRAVAGREGPPQPAGRNPPSPTR
jgi:hypothetical protein